MEDLRHIIEGNLYECHNLFVNYDQEALRELLKLIPFLKFIQETIMKLGFEKFDNGSSKPHKLDTYTDEEFTRGTRWWYVWESIQHTFDQIVDHFLPEDIEHDIIHTDDIMLTEIFSENIAKPIELNNMGNEIYEFLSNNQEILIPSLEGFILFLKYPHDLYKPHDLMEGLRLFKPRLPKLTHSERTRWDFLNQLFENDSYETNIEPLKPIRNWYALVSKREADLMRSYEMYLQECEIVDIIKKNEKLQDKKPIFQVSIENFSIVQLRLENFKEKEERAGHIKYTLEGGSRYPSIENLKNLKDLFLDNNHIGIFPKVLKTMHQIEKLSYRNNFLYRIPEWVRILTNLSYLDVRQNMITSIPCGLSNQLKVFIFDNN